MFVGLRFKAETYLTRPAVFAAFLLVVQLGLGVAAFLKDDLVLDVILDLALAIARVMVKRSVLFEN